MAPLEHWMMVGIPLRLRLPLLIELGDSKSHPADWGAIQGLAIRAIDLVGAEKLGNPSQKGNRSYS